MNTTTMTIGSAQLTVDTQELFRAWLEKHVTRSPAPAPLIRPPLNEGERYVGAILRPDLTGYHLIRMPLTVAIKLKWKAAMDHAAEKGGELPDRPEAALLFATREEGEFAEEWYWTREQHAGSDDYAWCQNFAGGNQHGNHKDGQYRVVLVRRVPIESLSH
jgi:hypothetical protein